MDRIPICPPNRPLDYPAPTGRAGGKGENPHRYGPRGSCYSNDHGFHYKGHAIGLLKEGWTTGCFVGAWIDRRHRVWPNRLASAYNEEVGGPRSRRRPACRSSFEQICQSRSLQEVVFSMNDFSSPEEVVLEAVEVGRRAPDTDRWLLDRVSLAIYPGEPVALAGPTGSGKTLLLRALAMLDPLEQGEIRWQGHPVEPDAIPDFRRQTIYLHQRASLHADTVEEALLRPLRFKVHRGRSFDRSALVDSLGELGRDESFLQKRTGDLSGGELQIVALLRAIQLEPLILLLDEPTAALDDQASKAVETLVDLWRKQLPSQRAFVWVTHDAGQARRVARRIVRMERGHIIEEFQKG